MAPNFRTLRHGIDIGWDKGRNFYRGENVTQFGLLRSLDSIANIMQFQLTEFGFATKRHFPPDFPVNDWLNNERTYPMPGQQERYLTASGGVVVIDPSIEPTTPFPPTEPVPPATMPDIFSTAPAQGKWLYDPIEWKLVGKVLFHGQATEGYAIWSRVDNAWLVWNGTAWTPFLRGQVRSMEINAASPRQFFGGFFSIFVAVESFVIPKDMPGTTGIATVSGNVTMQLRRNADQFGTLTFLTNGRAFGSSSEDIEFSPGDRLVIYAEGNTRNMKEASVTIKGLYS